MLAKDYMTKDVVTVEIPSNRDDVLRILKRTGISGVPVVKGPQKKLIGIVTRKDILRKAEETQVALLMTADPLTIRPDVTLSEAAEIMTKMNVRRLPVVEGDTLLGLLSVSDLVGAVAKLNDTREIRSGFVSKKTYALWEETPLPVVGRIMELARSDAMPILNSENKLTGIISERDLIRCSSIEDDVQTSDFSTGTDDDEWTWESIRDNHTISYGISKVELPNRPVKLCMVKKVISVPLNAEISDCALKMKRGRVDQLPVINNDMKLTGMLFDRDVIRALIK
ncbi:MAG: CBS domain-containing protein [Methanocorpusculum sp.]|nr:CBS domain-containing protein [Methanocorpusculum sp.]MDD4133088.1 CBS domain-containing protein [Methanocorpusculum sp.]